MHLLQQCWSNKLSLSVCISWQNHTSSKFGFRTCLVFSAYIAGIHFLLWMEVIVHRCRQMNQPNTMIETNQWTFLKFLKMLPFIFQTTLRSYCFVVISYHWQEKTRYYVLSASSSHFWRCPAPGKFLALKNILLLVWAFSCFWMLNVCLFVLSMVISVSNIAQRVNIIIKIFLRSIFFIFWTTQSNIITAVSVVLAIIIRRLIS